MATGVGFDQEPKVIAIAKTVLPASRMRVYVQDMTQYHADHDSYEHILIPGALCYLHSLEDVRQVLAELIKALRDGGMLCASMLPGLVSHMGSCNVRIPKALWMHLNGMILVNMDKMDSWNLPHAMGRYSVCLQKSPVSRTP
jgi:hypothetical protein